MWTLRRSPVASWQSPLDQGKPIRRPAVSALLVLLFTLAAETPTNAQYPAPVPRTGQVASYAAGDDGDLQMGVEWPVPRFTDNGDGTVADNLTGLVWLKDADCFGRREWRGALDACNNLADGLCGIRDGSSPGDWRLPNIRELRTLVDHGNRLSLLPSGHPFTDVPRDAPDYWTSTTVAGETEGAWRMELGDKVSGTNDFRGFHPAGKNGDYRVWPVRGW